MYRKMSWDEVFTTLLAVFVIAFLVAIAALVLERQSVDFRSSIDRAFGRIEVLPEDSNCTAAIADALNAVGNKTPTEMASKPVAGTWYPKGPEWAGDAQPQTIVRETKMYTALDTYDNQRGVLGLRGMLEGKEVTYGLGLPAGLPRENAEALRKLLKENVGGILYIWYQHTGDKIAIVGGNGNRWEWPAPKAP